MTMTGLSAVLGNPLPSDRAVLLNSVASAQTQQNGMTDIQAECPLSTTTSGLGGLRG